MCLPGTNLIGSSSACATNALASSQRIGAATSRRGSFPLGSRTPSATVIRQSSSDPSLCTQHSLALPPSQYAAVLELSAWVSSDPSTRLMMSLSLICDQLSDETEGESLFKDGFDEDKCRNVLVRHCAHIPRNYQYRDGIRLVFLVLRDHLGDEHLGRAGGVLYEMIEVDCHHSDDPGAAFQRWRHDHMQRHANLELPHIPHLTTISTSITPTATLREWRLRHPERYHIRLSDHSVGHVRSSSSPLRHRKSWTIDYTTYVSSRDGGTWPMRRLKPQEFHEMHWSPESPQRGRFVKERSVDLRDMSFSSLGDAAFDAGLLESPQSSASSKRIFRPRSLSEVVIRAFGKVKTHGKRNSKNSAELATDLQDLQLNSSVRNLLEPGHQPQVSEWEIPNAAFARKFGLLKDGHSLPTSIRELPVAEDKAIFKAEDPTVPDLRLSLGFQGPFTPQLWFDGGLDYRYQWE